MKRKMNVTEKQILGKGKNLYLINWSRIANFGYDLIRADDEEQAIENYLFSQNPYVNLIITKVSEGSLPVIAKGWKNENI